MFRRLVAILVVSVSLFAWMTIPAAASEVPISDVDAMCANSAMESVSIDGVMYTYHYYYTADGNRAIDVTYSNSTKIDTVVYNQSTNELRLNGNVVTLPDEEAKATDGWETLGTDTVYISWEPGIEVGLLAAMIAGAVGVITSSVVVGALGNGLAYLATQAFSATISLESQWLNIPPAIPQYRMIWTLTDSNGETHGPFISHYTA